MVNELAASLLVDDGFDMHSDFGAGWWVVMLVGMLILGGVWLVRELAHMSDVFYLGPIQGDPDRGRAARAAGFRT